MFIKILRANNFYNFLLFPTSIYFLFLISFGTVSVYASGNSSSEAIEERETMIYETGKKLFHELVVCESCSYADLELNSESVRVAWPVLKRDLNRSGEIGKNLKLSHRHAIRVFIQKRFLL